MKLHLLVPVFLLLSLQWLVAQNAPVTTIATASNAVQNQPVTVPVSVTGFNAIGSFTLTMDYEFTLLHFVSGSPNPSLYGNFNVGDNDLGNGFHRVVLAWYGAGTSMPDGSAVVTLVFTYLYGSPPLVWYEMGPSCEYTDASAGILNDQPSSSYYINGRVCGQMANPGPVSGNTAVCQGQSSVLYSIAPVLNATSYSWTVPPGALITAGENTTAILVDFPVSAVSGNVTVNGVNECASGPVSSLPVSVFPVPVANAGNDSTVSYGSSAYLHAAAGGVGVFAYHWSPENLFLNPDLKNPQTVPLTVTTLFSLTVSSPGTTCSGSDNVTISISGGPLSVNPSVLPGIICRAGTAQLFANAGGGTGNYIYSWTCIPAGFPPWTSNEANPVISPDSSTNYQLTVSDGFSSSSGSAGLVVNQLPTAAISGGDSLCDDGSVAMIRIDLTGVPPWSFIYSDGTTSTTVFNQYSTPYFFSTSVPGEYTVLSIQDASCEGTSYGSAMVAVSPVPAPPVITGTEPYLVSDRIAGNQWYKDEIAIPGADEQSFQPLENGLYYDVITMHGCSSDSSNNILVTWTGLENIVPDVLQIFPNPAKEYIIIRSSCPPAEIMHIGFFSSYGRFLKNYEITGGLLSNDYRIDLYGFECGIYLLRIENGKSIIIKKLVIL